MMIFKKSDNQNRRVVVTGLGVISSLGIGWQEFWPNIMAGKSGISRVESFDTTPYDRHYAGEVKNFDPAKFMNPRKAARIGRASQMAIAASKLALQDAKASLQDLKSKKVGVCLGTTMGEPQVMEKLDEKCFPKKGLSVDFLSALSYPASAIVANVANEFKLKGDNIIFSNACAAGNYAIARSYDLIKLGRVDGMLAGGVDALSRIAFTGFGRLFAMAPEKCQPFDKNRKGMMIGEGAGVLFLETMESAQKRKAAIYAEIIGYGLSCDAQHMTVPSIDGISLAVRKSLENSHVTSEKVDYISAHGTGTIENDKAESTAMRRVFDKRFDKIPMSSIKSMLGHTMGAAAALEAIACCLAVHRQEAPPTINFEEGDPECRVDCVPNKGRKQKVRVALNNSQAFGGNNACVILQKTN